MQQPESKKAFTRSAIVLWVVGALMAGLGGATFKPSLGPTLFKMAPILENKTIAWGLVAVGFILLTIAVVRLQAHLKSRRAQQPTELRK